MLLTGARLAYLAAVLVLGGSFSTAVLYTYVWAASSMPAPTGGERCSRWSGWT